MNLNHQSSPTSTLDLLKSNRFFPLFISQLTTAFNDNVFKNALIIVLTYRLSEGAGWNASLSVNLAAGLFILPFFLFSAIAGQIADRYEKSRLIKIIKFSEIILVLLAIYGLTVSNIWLLFLSLFLFGTQAAFFGPIKYAILPEQLESKELVLGNGLVEASTFVAILLGTIIGGFLILSSYGIALISAILLAGSVIGFIASLRIPSTSNIISERNNKDNKDNKDNKINLNIFSETLNVLRHSTKTPKLLITILGISWFWLIGSIFISLFPIVTSSVLRVNEYVSLYFVALFTLGISLGSLIYNHLAKGRVRITYIPLSILGMTFFIFDFYFAINQAHITINAINNELIPLNDTFMSLGEFIYNPKNLRISIDLLFISVFGGLYTVPLYTLIQQYSEDSHRARVLASNNIFNSLFMVIGSIMMIILSNFGFNVADLFLVLALSCGIVSIYTCKLLPDEFIKSFFIWALKMMYRVKVEGLENFENSEKRLLIVANHTSFIDALLLAAFLPDTLTYAVDVLTSQKWWVRCFLKMVDYFPLNPTNPIAVRSLIEFIKQDKKCVIFPEGRLTMTGALMKVYEGPGLIADKSNAKILPVRIQGAQFTPFSRMKGKVRIQLFPKITITLFPPRAVTVPEGCIGRARRQVLSLQMYDLLSETLFESSDYYKSLFQSLIDAKSLHGGKYKVIEDIDRNPNNYFQFMTRTFILGSMIARKADPLEPVGVLLPNMISAALTFFALQAYSRVPAMLNFSAGARNVVIACQTAKIRLVYTSIKFVRLAKLSDMIKALEDSGVEIIYLESLREQIGISNKIKGLLSALFPSITYNFINRAIPIALKDHNSAAVILFTSGSEGTPKGVVLSHQNIQANLYQLSARVDFIRTDKFFNALPIFHSFGLTAGMLLPLLSGVKVFLYPSPLHYRIIPELVYDTNATILFGTDTFLTAYAKSAHPYDFYSIRYVFAGAEKLREETRSTWVNKFGVRIFEGYGTTETSPVISTNTPMHSKIGTVGRFLPGIQYQLKPVPGVAEGGVLQVFGPNIMKGYLLADSPGLLMPPPNQWYDTGDIVSVDELGYVTIQGRVKRFAKIGGEMVSLTMVEQEINLLWPQYQHAVINLADDRKGEKLVLITTNNNAKREEIIIHAKKSQMPEIAIPKQILTIDKMPLLGTGKTDYTSVKEFALKHLSFNPETKSLVNQVDVELV